MYGHMSVSELEALRDQLQAAHARLLTGPSVAAGSGRRAEYQQNPAAVKREIQVVCRELKRRANPCSGGPIYMTVGR